MNWAGKVIGGVLGLATLGPWGAVLGALIGHQFDGGAGAGSLFSGGADAAQVNALFFPTTFRVMGHIAKADGRVSEQEIASARAVMHALHLNQAQMLSAMSYFNEGKQPAFALDPALQQLRTSISPYPDLANFFVEIQLQAALAGDGLSELPRARLRRVAQLLGLSAPQFERIETILRWSQTAAGARAAGAGTAGAGGNAGGSFGATGGSEERLAQAYSVLEATSAMSDEQIVKAYRRQMSRHHPDKLKANGLPDSMLERAKERTQQIQAAYEAIRARRGMR
ncbi:MAG TPA: co-chaperone DjlA [Steroidobacteraceae bacterium]|jgi:DnaJ like chaperone protein